MPTESGLRPLGFDRFPALICQLIVWSGLLLPAAVTMAFQEQEQERTRRIDFRDGSSLSIVVPDAELVWKNISKDGQVSERKIPFRAVKRISLVREPSTARVARIRNLLSQLSSEDYHERIKAQIQLTESGKEFEPIIEQYTPDDEETKWRINKVKEHLKEETGKASAQSTFDVIEMNDPESRLEGELELQGLSVRYGNIDIPVTREQVASISDQPLQADFVLSNSSGGGIRQQEYPNANGTMPPNMILVDFESLPNGRENAANYDVSEAYVANGVLFDTSIEDSYVGTQMYTFGLDGIYSIATVEPTYQGVITISFCVPGNKLFAAGTRYVGFNVSHVNPDGTWFEAYDAQDRLITRFATDNSGMDYLGFRSEVPIAKVLVRPNPEIDEDYAIDDLFFETPVALLESGNPRYFSVVTREGQRLQADSMTMTDEELVLKDLSFGAAEIALPVSDIWVMIPPRSAEQKFSPDAMANLSYCLLDDGSIVLADLSKGLRKRFSETPLKAESIVAFWGLDQQLVSPPTYPIRPDAAAVFAKGSFFDLEGVKLGSTWLESPSVEKLAEQAMEDDDDSAGVDLTKASYRTSPCVFLKSPPDLGDELGALYTSAGERYLIGDGFHSVKVQAGKVVLSRDSANVELGWDEIRSLRLPQN